MPNEPIVAGQSATLSLRILHLEDNSFDAELMQTQLEAEGVSCTIKRVETREAFLSALEKEQFDLVISDFTLPSFDGVSALSLCRESKPDVPFIFVSGTIGEESAVQSLKSGATDYILKDRMTRLAASVRRAVQEAQGRAERRRADEKIREQAALLDKARDAICVTDMEQRVLYWNKSAERLYGWSAEEIAGGSADELLFPGESTRAVEAIKQLIRQDEWQGTLNKVGKDGRKMIVDSHWTLLRDEAGQPKSILVLDTDVTEKKQIEAQLVRTQRMQSIGALAAGIAHDLNNVLSPILLVAELIRGELASDDSRAMLDTATASAQRGAEMVKQILSFARGVSDELKLLQAKHLVSEMVKLVRDTFPKSIQIQSNVAMTLHPVCGDATQLHQLLLNLCVNARDAMPSGGTLRLEAANVELEHRQTAMLPQPVSGKFVVLSVADTGCGIPAEVQERIFEPFFTTKEPGKGTGLGLATVLAVVKTHQGFVEVASEVGRGTVFRVYLPAATTAETSFIKLGLPAMQAGRGETILVVDDEAAILEITKETLETFNYRVLTAADGSEALALYREHWREISVVVTDVIMPVMDGPALVGELRTIRPEVRIVCISGLGSKERSDEISELKPHAYLTKPYAAEKLLNTLHEIISMQ
jgi:two-component system, cell cycle sensor histidine kinase and response regulator CckA